MNPFSAHHFIAFGRRKDDDYETAARAAQRCGVLGVVHDQGPAGE